MDKVFKNGQIAVAISTGFGGGWSTWNSDISPFEPKVIEMILDDKQGEISEEWCEKHLGIKQVYCGGASQLEIEWIPEGVSFSINEYDGSESTYRSDELTHTA